MSAHNVSAHCLFWNQLHCILRSGTLLLTRRWIALRPSPPASVLGSPLTDNTLQRGLHQHMRGLSRRGARSLPCLTYTSPTSMKPAWARGSVTATNARLVLAASCTQRPHVRYARIGAQRPATIACTAVVQRFWSVRNSPDLERQQQCR